MSTEENEKFAATLSLIEDLTSRCDEEQVKVLSEILSQNAETEYLKRHGIEGVTDKVTFKTKVPVVTYEDILPDIQRISDGDFSPILCAQPVTQFYHSSGTSAGKKKLIPATADNFGIVGRALQLSSFLTPIINLYMPGLDKGKALSFQFIKEETKTPGGLVATYVSTSMYKSPYFVNRPFDPYNVITSPNDAILCPDIYQSMYTQMICGLYDRLVVLRIVAFFPSGLLWAINFLRYNYQDICHDISTGVLNPRITDEALRACMTKIMRPDPELSGFVEYECGEEKWEGIITRIWPNTKYLSVIVSGSMAQYIPKLDYYSGGLPKVSPAYACSECFFGINLKPFCKPSEISYTIFPNMGYFEFIPLDGPSRDSMAQTVDLANVELGKEYEIVVTTYAGLYRYRVGDLLRVTGFHNSTPQFMFVRRKNVLLSIDIDNTDELQLQNAIETASVLLRPSNTKMVDYTSYPDTKTEPGHYVIYWELVTEGSMNGPGPKVLEQCCLEIEEALDTFYRECRVVNRTVGPLEIRVVKSRTFEEMMKYAISEGASINQYKVPKCVNAIHMVELLDSRVVSAHFSPSMPHWSP